MGYAAEDGLRAMTDLIVSEASPEKVILFGSQARGEAGPESDVDLLVIEAQPFGAGRSRRQEMARLARLLARFPVPQDILVYSAEETARWQHSKNHVLGRALREGRVLYERA